MEGERAGGEDAEPLPVEDLAGEVDPGGLLRLGGRVAGGPNRVAHHRVRQPEVDQPVRQALTLHQAAPAAISTIQNFWMFNFTYESHKN